MTCFLQIERRRHSIRLIDVMPSDSGNFTCIVSNRYGQISHSYTVDVFSMYHKDRPNFGFGLGFGAERIDCNTWYTFSFGRKQP